MGYNKQLNDSYRVVYTDTGSTALPDISNFSHTGVYSLIAKPSQLGTAVTIGFSVVSGGKVTNTTLAEGNYFVEYSELETAKYWNFSFLGKASSAAKFTAQNTMVTYDKSKGTYTVKTDSLSSDGANWTKPFITTITLTPAKGSVMGTPTGTSATTEATVTADKIFYADFTDILLPTINTSYTFPYGFNIFNPGNHYHPRGFALKTVKGFASKDGTGTSLACQPVAAAYNTLVSSGVGYYGTQFFCYFNNTTSETINSLLVSGTMYGVYL